MTDDERRDLGDDEWSIFALMAVLRDYSVRLSSAFVSRVSDELDRSAAESGPGVSSMVGGVLVEILNLVCGVIGIEDDGTAEDNDRDPEEDP